VGNESRVSVKIPTFPNERRRRSWGEESRYDRVVSRWERSVAEGFHRVEMSYGELGMGRKERSEEVVVSGDRER
jgi:hypothetical protein